MASVSKQNSSRPSSRRHRRMTAGLKISNSLFTPSSTNTRAARDSESEAASNNASGSTEVASSSRTRRRSLTSKSVASKITPKNSGSSRPPRRRRATRKSLYSLFVASASTTKTNSRPSYTLTRQLNYITDKLPSKIQAIRKATRTCPIERCHMLSSLEDNISIRLGIVNCLKIDRDDAALLERKGDVHWAMQDKLLELQDLSNKLSRETKMLRTANQEKYGRTFCCLICKNNN